ncbi:MAG: NAD-dependent epimerase/dehydratase family protein, partial [Gammaproteobacteria bacterium]|nr:NAD-dependent epimerase/dehydratase family protein [Gammaproteobacteria bacterium]
YGPGSIHKASVVAKFVKLALAGETLEIYGDGQQTRDFIYIDDLVRAALLSANNDVGGEVFQIASSRETTVGEITDQMVDILEDRGFKDIKVKNGETRLGDVKRNFSDTSKAKRVLGWEPQVERDEGLPITIDWFLDRLQN